MWNTSVSDRCCQSCEGVVYKADSVIDTIHHEDDCQTTETSFCRILPGELINIFILLTKTLPKDHDKAVVQTEFKYKNCCDDGQGR